MEITWSGKTIAQLSLHYRKTSLKLSSSVRLGLEYLFIVSIYLYAIYWCATSVIENMETTSEDVITNAEFERVEEEEAAALNKKPEFHSFWAFLFLGCVVALHLLFELSQHWSVNIKCAIKFKNTIDINRATHVKVTPKSHRGVSEIVPLLDRNGTKYFYFQKRIYICEKEQESAKGHGTRILFRKWTPPTNLQLTSYINAKGLTTSYTDNILAQFGLNKFEIPSPSFAQLYKEQLLTPIAVFQLFSIALWSLDSYWQYSLFSLSMMLLFEASVAFSRIRTLQTLRGMSNPARSIYVFRDGAWKQINTEQLIPGDLISLRRGQTSVAPASTTSSQPNSTQPPTNTPASLQTTNDGVVPCDCLLLSGSMVVNEATLTGESIPQMKEAIARDQSTSEILDMKNIHKLHIVFGGTSILQNSGHHASSQTLSTPDEGCLCYVLRTGFHSSQGKLVRMIEFSADKVKGNTKESLMLLGFLCCFALIASAYVLKRGLEDATRSKYELLLHCILIITSVIPPELPMQMALAVNTSLLTLIRQFIFCTEPFRIPLAGKVDICFFDKTGTITTDELVAVNATPWSQGEKSNQKAEDITMDKLPFFPSLVLGGCHSLLVIDGKLIGDPLETASVKSIKWDVETREDDVICFPKEEQSEKRFPAVTILHRHHFASKLQRMSTIVSVKNSENDSPQRYVLVKGSPEIISTLLVKKDGAIPNWYQSKQLELTKKGMRVIGLAYKRIDDSISTEEVCKQSRDWAEKDLLFVSFISFRCLVRKDSKNIIQALLESSHRVIMITGDAILTGAHVASEVGIIHEDKNKQLILESLTTSEANELCWRNVETNVISNFNLELIDSLSNQYDLCVSGAALRQASQMNSKIWDKVHLFKVFARMTPEEKETIITCLNDRKHFTLMCGDGANDVGALKQSHVGVALLSGFGSANVEKQSDAIVPPPPKPVIPTQMTREERSALMLEKRQQFERDVKEMTERGESWAIFKALKIYMQREKDEGMRRAHQNEKAAVYASIGAQLDETDVPIVKLGDASVAAPFTSKAPSIKSTLDIIRQGRCTLVTTLQMYQILALNCLISSYSLSVLYLDGVKYGDVQMTFLGILMAISFISISYAKPLEKLSPVRPLNSIFHPAMFVSLIGQFAIHLFVMMYVLYITKPFLPEGFKPKLEGEFEPNLINSIVFLVSAIQQVSVFAVNYKGHPFMQGFSENRSLRFSLYAIGLGAFLCATETIPEFNSYIQLVPFPNEELQYTIITLLIFNISSCFIWDRIMLRIFAPQLASTAK